MRLWSSCGILAVGLVAFVVLLTEPHAAWGEIPREALPYDDTLQMVLDRIHEHAKDEAWRAPGWKDEKIEAWLDKLVTAVGKGTERPELKLPVRMADLQPADPGRPRLQRHKLLITRGSQYIGFGVRDSLILADGNLQLMMPQNCVIVARGAVQTGGALNCVIVAGAYIGTQTDGQPGARDGGSLLVTRGMIDAPTASVFGSTLIADLGTNVNSSEGAVFVNQPVPVELQAFPQHKDSRSVEIANLPIEPFPKVPLAEKLTLLGTIVTPQALGPGQIPVPRFASRGGNFTGAVVRFDKQRYVADLNQPIVDQAGQPVEALSGWELTFATDRVALFSREGSDALVRMHVEAE